MQPWKWSARTVKRYVHIEQQNSHIKNSKIVRYIRVISVTTHIQTETTAASSPILMFQCLLLLFYACITFHVLIDIGRIPERDRAGKTSSTSHCIYHVHTASITCITLSVSVLTGTIAFNASCCHTLLRNTNYYYQRCSLVLWIHYYGYHYYW